MKNVFLYSKNENEQMTCKFEMSRCKFNWFEAMKMENKKMRRTD